ncbi:MAG: O-antigen ligase family protein [Pseudomonadota bacterium]
MSLVDQTYSDRGDASRRRARVNQAVGALSGKWVVLGITIILMVSIGTNLPGLVLGEGGPVGPLKLAILGPMLLFIAQYHRYFFRGLFSAPELTALMLLALVSAGWSLDTAETIERLFPLLVTTALAMTLGGLLSVRALILFLATMCLFMMLACVVAIGIFPSARGIPPWEGTWRGIFNHKNGLGSHSMISFLLCFSAMMLTKGRLRPVFGAGAFIALVMLVASESRTAQIIGLIGILALTAGFSYPRNLAIWVTGTILFAFSVVFGSYVMIASGLADPIFEALERRATLSGRIPLWQLVWPQVLDRFWLGYGYVSFWDPDARRVVEIARDPTLRFTPYYSHNGLIETLLNVGFVGVVLFVGALVRGIAGVYAILRTTPRATFVIPLTLVMIAFLLQNVTESSILSRSHVVWMSFIAVLTKMGVVGRTLRREAALERIRRRRQTLGQFGPERMAAGS